MRVLIILIFITISNLYARTDYNTDGTKTISDTAELCWADYNSQCKRYIEKFKQLLGTDFHWQQELHRWPATPWGDNQINFVSQYRIFNDTSDTQPTFEIRGRNCQNIEQMTLSYQTRIGSSSYQYERHPPSIKLEFSDNQCNIRKATIRPIYGIEQEVTAQSCSDNTRDISRGGVSFFDLCQTVFNITPPFLQNRTGSVDCIDCERYENRLLNINRLIRLDGDLRRIQEHFDREQQLKASSQVNIRMIQNAEQILASSLDEYEIQRALSDLYSLMPLESVYTLLMSIPTRYPRDIVFKQYLKTSLAMLKTERDIWGREAYPDRAIENRTRMKDQLISFFTSGNNSPERAKILLSTAGLIRSKHWGSREILGQIKSSLPTLASQISLNGTWGDTLSFISDFSQGIEDPAVTDQAVRIEFISILQTIRSNTSRNNVKLVDWKIQDIELINFITSPSTENSARIMTSDSFKKNKYDPKRNVLYSNQLKALRNSADPQTRQNVEQLIDYLKIR